jgi:hypothetical protein
LTRRPRRAAARDARIEPAEQGYWRTSIDEEVDFVIEAGGKHTGCAIEWLAQDVLVPKVRSLGCA